MILERGISMPTFTLFHNEIRINDEMDTFNNLKQPFYENAFTQRDFFCDRLRKEVHNMDDLMEKVPHIATECISQSVELAIRVLVEKGILTRTPHSFIEEYYAEFFEYSHYFDVVKERYLQIVYTENELQNYREIQRSDRSKWQGGGFGLSGAVKGAVTASVLNLGQSVVRGVSDSIVNANDAAKIREAKHALFTNHDTLKILIDGVFDCCFQVFYGVLCEYEAFTGYRSPSVESDTASAILENTKKYVKEEGQILTNVIQSINMNPYNFDSYAYLYDIFGDENGEIEQIVTYFGFGLRFNKLKEQQMQILFELPENTLQEMCDKKQKIIEKAKLLQWNCTNELSKLDEAICEKKKQLEREEAERKKQVEKENRLVSRSEKLRQIKAEIDGALKTGNISYVRENAVNGNGYAGYALESYFKDATKISMGKCYAFFESEYKNDQYDSFTLYMLGRCLDQGYGIEKNEKQSTHFYQLAAQKGSISAKFMLGFKYSHGYGGLKSDYKKGSDFLKESAEYGYPYSFAWIGSFYRKGERGFKADENKARESLTIAANIFDIEFAKKELNKLNNGNTGGCFITTATLKILKVEDDGYELEAFRNYRDNWLLAQSNGESIIQEYYAIAPSIVKGINKQPNSLEIYKELWEQYLSSCLSDIENQQYEACKETYIRMVKDLRKYA